MINEIILQMCGRKFWAWLLAILLATSSTYVAAQKTDKPWTEWSKNDVEKMLNDSPWGQTQTETDISEMFFTPTTATGGGDSSSRRGQGATNQATALKFRIRWLSARPIRQALARSSELEGGKMTEQMLFFAEGPSDKRTVIAVTFDSNDQRFSGKAMQVINSANTGVLKNITYLERKDGKRVFLQEYVPPQHNRLGMALFIFPRFVDEQPLLNQHSGTVRFHSEYENKTTVDKSSAFKFTLDMKFKVSDMIYKGNLEY